MAQKRRKHSAGSGGRPRGKGGPKKRPKKRRRALRWLTNILLLLVMLAGVGLVFNDQIKNWVIEHNTDKFAIENMTREDIEKNLADGDATYDFDQVESISTEAVLRAQFGEGSGNIYVIGAIAVPDVGINLPIFKGVAYNALFYGAGTTKENQTMGEGNYGLASHRAADMSLLFSPLEKVSKGQLIYLTDLTKVYTYKITMVERVNPNDGYVLNEVEGKKLVTLVTCADGAGIKRLIVQGELTKTVAVEDASEVMANAFNSRKTTY